jgi:hypothetical protein
MKKPPTDFDLLRAIYGRYHAAWVSFTEEQERHADAIADEQGHDASTVRWYHRNAVPIDLGAIARDLGVDANAVHGRLYHHLDRLYGPSLDKDGRRTGLFIPRSEGRAEDVIVFPVLEAALAGLWQQRRHDLWTRSIAVISLVIAGVALVVSIVTA